MFKSNPGANMTCGFKVKTQSPGWQTSMTKVLSKINGASYAIDVEEGMAYVTGRVNPSSLLKKLKQSNKHAELSWVTTGSNPMHGNAYENYERYKQDVGVGPTYPYSLRPPVPGPGYGYGPGYPSHMPAPGYPPHVPYAPNYGGYQPPFVYDPNAFWHRNIY